MILHTTTLSVSLPVCPPRLCFTSPVARARPPASHSRSHPPPHVLGLEVLTPDQHNHMHGQLGGAHTHHPDRRRRQTGYQGACSLSERQRERAPGGRQGAAVSYPSSLSTSLLLSLSLWLHLSFSLSLSSLFSLFSLPSPRLVKPQSGESQRLYAHHPRPIQTCHPLRGAPWPWDASPMCVLADPSDGRIHDPLLLGAIIASGGWWR